MHGDEGARDHDLRFGTNIAWPLRRFGSRVENPRDPVGFGEEGAVYYGKSDADPEPLYHAGDRRGLDQEGEGVEIAHQDAAQ